MVKGFKNFASKIEFDLTSGNYTFNDEIIQSNIITIYGNSSNSRFV